MNAEQILKLVDAVSNSSLTELNYEGDGMKISMKKAKHALPQSARPLTENSGKVDAVYGNESMENGSQAAVSEVKMTEVNAVSSAAAAVSATMQTAAVQADVISQKNTATPGNTVKSPLVGTFYAAPAEDAEPFVKVGDKVEKGQVLAIVEAMKLMNEIESDFSGTVTEILVTNGESVEYGQPLFMIG